MKKIAIICIFSGLFLVGCGDSNKDTKTANSKVDQLESRVKELESSSSTEKEDTATEIVNTFKEKGLPVFDPQTTGQEKLNESDYDLSSSNYFYYAAKDSIPDTLFANLINVEVATDKENTEKIINNNETRNENAAGDRVSWLVRYVVNEKLNAVLTVGSAVSDEDFNKYKEVFEQIK
ncbi:hypothetical protein ATZ33_17260 [Enterococcus silesiacus]|uniref:DUF4367 domain-containing protein n=1 Tax=Enterococcus silesiacus TaxID=332949 RepID=A0A0S3KFK4_9ENTE|nr:hypothetical protein [Enterococcus silesiacus]ALS03062.1 hypothetical protein ATZ33_17260 [Enterococcus silesiacus]OJG93008.1 hypothetical protein RV15_GL002142 [Enterococcus silesiacus]